MSIVQTLMLAVVASTVFALTPVRRDEAPRFHHR